MKVKNPFIALFISLLTIPACGHTVAVRADATRLVGGIQSKFTVRRDELAIP